MQVTISKKLSHRIMGALVCAERTDLAKIMADSIKGPSDELEGMSDIDKSRNTKHVKNFGKIEKELVKKFNVSHPERKVKNSRNADLYKEFDQKKQAPKVTKS